MYSCQNVSFFSVSHSLYHTLQTNCADNITCALCCFSSLVISHLCFIEFCLLCIHCIYANHALGVDLKKNLQLSSLGVLKLILGFVYIIFRFCCIMVEFNPLRLPTTNLLLYASKNCRQLIF